MKFRVILKKSEEGIAVSCPALVGCHSQGKNIKEAMANIKEAIQLWLEVAAEEEKKIFNHRRFKKDKVIEKMIMA